MSIQQIHTGFQSSLVRLATRRIHSESFSSGDGKDQSERVVLRPVLRFVDRTNGAQTFLDGMQSRWGVQGIRNLFQPPLAWKSLSIELADRLEFDVAFDEQEFEARLRSIKVRRAFRKGLDEVVYDIEMELDYDQEVATALSHYLNLREEDPDSGRKFTREFGCDLRPTWPQSTSGSAHGE